MAKGRMLLKRISMSEKVNKGLSCDTSRLLYTWILSHLDVNGCYYADPILVKNTIFPWREDVSISNIKKYLQEMRDCGLIVLFGDNNNYLHYPDFIEKQPKINVEREGKTDIPAPTQEQLRINSGATPTQSNIREDKVREDKRRESKKDKSFIAPSVENVINYFQENGYRKDAAEKAYNYYSVSDWKDSKGNQVKNWKQKMIAVWFKDENKTGSFSKHETAHLNKAEIRELKNAQILNSYINSGDESHG